jgi:hypothetical protein
MAFEPAAGYDDSRNLLDNVKRLDELVNGDGRPNRTALALIWIPGAE